MTTRVAVPSKGRLRDSVAELLRLAGYQGAVASTDASAVVEDIEFIAMRPRDAATWLAAGRLDAAFISTDTAMEAGVGHLHHLELGFARSDLIVACRTDAPFASAADLAGATVATHLPNWTAAWFGDQGIDINIVAMGGSLEGICARGMADAIVDLRETGMSLARNSLHAIEEVRPCQAVFAMASPDAPAVSAMALRIEAARLARRTQYLVLHIAPDRVEDLGTVFPGLAAPTLVPLSGRDDLVAAHMVVDRSDLWSKLADLRSLGATGIVALPTDAIVE
jgi:ATP phosphoribosyltransferase